MVDTIMHNGKMTMSPLVWNEQRTHDWTENQYIGYRTIDREPSIYEVLIKSQWRKNHHDKRNLRKLSGPQNGIDDIRWLCHYDSTLAYRHFYTIGIKLKQFFSFRMPNILITLLLSILVKKAKCWKGRANVCNMILTLDSDPYTKKHSVCS